jgi:hypothetical protein
MIMKKLIFGFIALFLITSSVQAQDMKKVMKTASKALSAYRLDNADKEKMKEAVDNIEQLAKMDIPADSKADVYILRGDIYNEIATQVNTSKSLNLNTAEGLPEVKHPELIAFESYKVGLENASKKYHTKDALTGIRTVQNYMSMLGIEAYQAQDYEGAYKAFKSMLDADVVLKENGEESALSTEENLNNQYYLIALAAYSADKKDISKEYFTKLYDMGSEEPAVYEYLYKMGAESGDLEGAYKYLEEGRKKFPEEIGLLFSEINHFLQLGKSEELIDKIQQAIAAEPKNVSLYNVLGNTYDGLNQAAAKAGEQEKADEYLALAFEQFKKAYEIDPTNTVAVYSMGQLFYNRAAVKTLDLQKYASDYSKEGMKKYEAAREAVFAEFDKALPFFQKSEALNPSDNNTLIALKEIYAKKDNLETSDIFKNRLEKIRTGEEVSSSHFKSDDVDIDVIIARMKINEK